MKAFETWKPYAVLASVCWCACAAPSNLPPLSAEAQAVQVAEAEPPAGAQALGQVVATDGEGCAIGGSLRGTRERATVALKEAVARRGANFVKVTSVKEPYSGRDCYHQEFTLQGLAYHVGNVPPAREFPPGASAAPVAVDGALSGAPPTSPASASPVPCVPLCSSGYECHAGVCEALCNPACAAGQKCRGDRVCVPVAP